MPNQDFPDAIVCWGASVRWAVEMISRSPQYSQIPRYAFDLFADQETQAESTRATRLEKLSDFPHKAGFLRKISNVLILPFGGVENEYEILRELAQLPGTVLAMSPVSALTASNSTRELAENFAGHYPEVRRHWSEEMDSGLWLCKPDRSAGGLSVRVASSGNLAGPYEAGFFQQRVRGVPYSLSFLTHAGQTYVCGMTRQLVGASFCPYEFAYCGSVTTCASTFARSQELVDYANSFACKYSLQGLWGVDFVLERNGHYWVVDVNPRPTASLEVLQHSHQQNLLEQHLNSFIAPHEFCFGDGIESVEESNQAGKFVIFNLENRIVWPGEQVVCQYFEGLCKRSGWRIAVKDVPAPGESIQPLAPICTLLFETTVKHRAVRGADEGWLDQRLRDLRTGLIDFLKAESRHAESSLNPPTKKL